MSLGVPTARRIAMMIRAAISQVVKIEFEIGIVKVKLVRSWAEGFTPSELAKTSAGEERAMRESERI
jgi:hypothetical protein